MRVIRTVAARDLTWPLGDRRVVVSTFDTYIGVQPSDGLQFRLSNVIGKLFWKARFRHYEADELTLGSLSDILNLDLQGLTIACGDTYLTERL